MLSENRYRWLIVGFAEQLSFISIETFCCCFFCSLSCLYDYLQTLGADSKKDKCKDMNVLLYCDHTNGLSIVLKMTIGYIDGSNSFFYSDKLRGRLKERQSNSCLFSISTASPALLVSLSSTPQSLQTPGGGCL